MFMITPRGFEIHPVGLEEVDQILEVYRQCEDFLALGPQPKATTSMVLEDLHHSAREAGVFCGIYNPAGEMVGVVDFVESGYGGDQNAAFLSLLLISKPFRSKGLGVEVVRTIEAEVKRKSQIKSIFSAVQVNNPAAIRFWERQGYRIVGGPNLNPDQTIVFHLKKDFYPKGKC